MIMILYNEKPKNFSKRLLELKTEFATFKKVTMEVLNNHQSLSLVPRFHVKKKKNTRNGVDAHKVGVGRQH